MNGVARRIRTSALWLAPLAATLALAGCNQGGQSSAPNGSISGAGATFPAPLYAKWAETYRTAAGIGVNYQAIGSGGGIKQIKEGTVDFGASDKPLKPDELAAAGLYQFPTVIGGVVPVVNLPGIKAGQLHLTGELLGELFLGKIKSWDDPALAAENAGTRLPHLPVTIVHRSDGSGTSFLFTSYLSLKNPEWKAKVGASDAVSWPVGIGGKGNDGVSAFVRQTAGSIGYVEYAYARQNSMTAVGLQNAARSVVEPSAANFAAAASGANWAAAPGNYLLLLDQPGAQSWPITGATFILLHAQQSDAAKGQAVLKFFDWAYAKGDGQASSLDYVPLPAAVKTLVRQQWSTDVTADGKPFYKAP